MLPISTAAQNANTSKPRKVEKHEEDDQAKGERHFDDKQTAMLPSRNRKPAPLDKTFPSKWMIGKKLSIDYRDKKLRLQFTSVWVKLKLWMIRNDHGVSVSHYGRCKVPSQPGLHGGHYFGASFAFPLVSNFESSCNRRK